MKIDFSVNGKTQSLEVDDPATPLLWVLRENLGLLGTKFGCGIGQCGACTVHLDGIALRSCLMPISAVSGRQITTIEGLAEQGLHPLQEAWIEEDVPQCGYCQTGQIMAAAAMLAKDPNPSDATIDQVMTNLCRCGAYNRIRKAIHSAAKSRSAETP